MFDVIIIGGGPGGYVAAIRASQLGLKVALVEEKHLGGICLNWGCIPTKALLKCGEVAELLEHLGDYGFSAEKTSFDFSKIIERSRGVSSKLAGGIKHLMKKNKVTVFENRAKLNGNRKVRLFDKKGDFTEDLEAKNIIVATGARARQLPNLEIDGDFIWSYKEAMIAKKQPKSLLVVGSGAIGIEFASFYNALGTKVTVVEMADRVLPVEDKEISKIAQKEFVAKGFNILTESTIKNINKKTGEVEIENIKTKKTETIKVDNIISAVGIVANSEDIGLEGVSVELDRGHIITDSNCETKEKGLYAIGDVAGAPWLAHKASHEAIIAANHIAGKHNHRMKKENIPGCTYSSPQIASVGLTEDAAKEQGLEIKIGRFNFMANGKAIAMGKDSGLIKVIFDKNTGELLGAHMVGAEVTEMIQGFVLAKSFEATEEDIKHTIFPHPTLSEMMHEAVLDADGEALHA